MVKTLVAVMLVALTGSALAQNNGARQAAPADPIVALTAEVRALRADLAEAARSSLRMQLLLARLQLQEQRIINLDRQRTDLTSRLATLEQERVRTEGAMKMFGGDTSKLSPEDRKNGNFMVDQFKAQVQALQAAEQQLRAEENQILGSLGAEQARWTDFSNRLDELERSLSTR